MNILRFAAVLAAGMAIFACQKVKETYEPATPEQGDRVYFMSEPTGTVKLVKESPSISIVVGRNSSAAALDAPLTVSGDATQYFNVPTKVSFAAGESKKTLTVDVKDINTIPVNNFFDLSMKVDDSLASVYGLSALSFKIGIELPWITFDVGTMVEGWWGETEPEMPMKYQQIAPNMRYCVVEGCWGHDTGEGYPVQPYVWYWNTETNACYVPCQFMGYSSGGNDAYISDEPAFYNWYWNMQEPGKNGSGLEQGTDAWFEWCDARRVAWEGDPFPYYDGAGKFYLGDWGFLVEPGTTNPTGSGFQFGGKQDTYICSFAADYTIGFSYDGIFTNKEDVKFAVCTVTYETKDVKDVALVLVEGKDPEAAKALLAEEECPQVVIISAGGTYNIPMPENAATGKYTAVALPLNGDGEGQWDFAMYETFQYVAGGGEEPDPLTLAYTADDFTAALSMEELLNTEWVGYGFELGQADWNDERTELGAITITDIENNEDGEELFTIHGLSVGAGPYWGFDDAILCDLYNGIIYTHSSTNGTCEYQGTPLWVITEWYDAASEEGKTYDINYALIGAYVADGLIALVGYPNYEEKYGVVFDGLTYKAYTDEEFSDEGYLGIFAGVRGILLADSAKFASEAAAISAAKKSLMAGKSTVKGLASATGKESFSFKPYDWSKDVVAGGRVYSIKTSVETKLNEVR